MSDSSFQNAGHDNPLRVGIVGLGAVSESHLTAYSGVAGISVVAGVEPRPARLKAMSDLHGFRPYASHTDMLRNEQLDLACILAPVNLHSEIAMDCAESGVHVFCEKPIAVTVGDAESMITGCRQYGVKLFYGASYRYLPAVMRARELIQSKAIGDVILISETIVGGQGRDGHVPMGFEHYPKGGPGGSGMGLVDHGVHLIDLFSWLTDSYVTGVFGRGNISGDTAGTEFVYARLSSGGAGHLLYNDSTFDIELPTEGIFSEGSAWSLHGYEPAGFWHAFPGCIRVYGTDGSLRIFHYANQLFLRDQRGMRKIALAHSPPPAQFTSQMKSIAESIRNDTPPEVGGDVGLQALRVLLAVYNSDQLKAWVDTE